MSVIAKLGRAALAAVAVVALGIGAASAVDYCAPVNPCVAPAPVVSYSNPCDPCAPSYAAPTYRQTRYSTSYVAPTYRQSSYSTSYPVSSYSTSTPVQPQIMGYNVNQTAMVPSTGVTSMSEPIMYWIPTMDGHVESPNPPGLSNDVDRYYGW